MAAAKKSKKRGSVPFWVSRDLTLVWVLLTAAGLIGFTLFLGSHAPMGSITECMHRYAGAHTHDDTVRVDSERPFDTAKAHSPSCGALKKTPEYARALRDNARRQHARA